MELQGEGRERDRRQGKWGGGGKTRTARPRRTLPGRPRPPIMRRTASLNSLRPHWPGPHHPPPPPPPPPSRFALGLGAVTRSGLLVGVATATIENPHPKRNLDLYKKSNQHRSVSFKRLDPRGPYNNPLLLSRTRQGWDQGMLVRALLFPHPWWRLVKGEEYRQWMERRKHEVDCLNQKLHQYSYTFRGVSLKLFLSGHGLWLLPYME